MDTALGKGCIWNKWYVNCGYEIKWRMILAVMIARSSHMIYFICIIHLHIFHGNIWTQNWPAPNVSGFIAQLVERRTGIARSRVQAPLKSWIFFQPSLRNCKNCDHNCEDHSSFDFISAVHIWFISYASFIIIIIIIKTLIYLSTLVVVH